MTSKKKERGSPLRGIGVALENILDRKLFSPEKSIGFFNARYYPGLADIPNLTCFQANVRWFDELRSHGVKVASEPTGSWDQVLIFGDFCREYTALILAEAFGHSSPGADIAGIFPNQMGGKRSEEFFRALFLDVETETRGRSRLVIGKRPAEDAELPGEFSTLSASRLVPGTDALHALPGMFSYREIDEGSKLLAENLPTLSGSVADLGCGWGYLASVCAKHPAVSKIHLVEADHRSLMQAQKNLKEDGRVETYWLDVANSAHWKKLPKVDWVIMNPPFHLGGEQDIELGLSFFKAAESILTRTGSIIWVANRHIPYLKMLGWDRAKIKLLAENSLFTVGMFCR